MDSVLSKTEMQGYLQAHGGLRPGEIEDVVALCKRRWKANAEHAKGVNVQDEFLDEDGYIAYMLAVAGNQVKRLATK